MKHLSTLLLTMTLLSGVHYSYCYVDQDFDAKLSILQQTIDAVIAQSDMDPEVAQDLTDKTNELGAYVQNNIQQNLKDIRVAAAMTSLLETVDKMAQTSNMTNVHNALSAIKYSARANTVHQLLISTYPEMFKNDSYYTDPYVESIGFIANDYAFKAFFNYLVGVLTPTTIGKLLQLDSSSPVKKWGMRVAAAVAAHFAWELQKKLAADRLAQMQAQNS